jgi:hypothetical protein
MEKKRLGRGLDDISNMFLTPRKDKKTPEANAEDGVAEDSPLSDNTKPLCDIEEHVSIRRNIAYPDTSDAQQDMLNAFSRHLEENYRIKRIELRKADQISRPGMEKYVEEKITIFIQGGADHGTHR